MGFLFRYAFSRLTTCRPIGRNSLKTFNATGPPTKNSCTSISSVTVFTATSRIGLETPAGDGRPRSVAGRSQCFISTCRVRSPSPPMLAFPGCDISGNNSVETCISGLLTAGLSRRASLPWRKHTPHYGNICSQGRHAHQTSTMPTPLPLGWARLIREVGFPAIFNRH